MVIERDGYPDIPESRLRSYLKMHFKRNRNKLFSMRFIMKKYGITYMTARKFVLDMVKDRSIIKYEYRNNSCLYVWNDNFQENIENNQNISKKIEKRTFF